MLRRALICERCSLSQFNRGRGAEHPISPQITSQEWPDFCVGTYLQIVGVSAPASIQAHVESLMCG
eukprot:1147112-Pelagomonas_calceolata.AAC.3